MNHHWFRLQLVAASVLSHYLNWYRLIVHWLSRNDIRWNLNGNSSIFIQESLFQNKDLLCCIIETGSPILVTKFRGQGKMVAISQIFSNAFYWMKFFKKSFTFPYRLLDDMLALVQIMAWQRTGDKPQSLVQWWRSSPTHLCVGYNESKELKPRVNESYLSIIITYIAKLKMWCVNWLSLRLSVNKVVKWFKSMRPSNAYMRQ